ncbi:unnamed protein product, partial [Medioppia subpectinata]
INGQKLNGFNWAVLVAGAHTWTNYRHQANIYHAYHLIKSHGIPDSNIIVMHYDDIAHHDSNPTPGVVINQPNGTNVYEGVPKHYTGDAVSAKNFLSVMKGDPLLALSGKKVLRSGPLDNVFIYFSDHGGHVAFASDYLYANDLNDALQYMYRRKMYSRLVFYMEACYSGSMFDQFLPNNINVYANTAANTTQSSYSRYYDSYRKTWLGDSYSSHWMENSEASNLAEVTLENQYELVKNITTTSHVQQYGDMKESNLPLSLFLGSKQPSSLGAKPTNDLDAVDATDVPIHTLNRTIESTTNSTEREILVEQLAMYLEAREFLRFHLAKLVDHVKDLLELEAIDDIMDNTRRVLTRVNIGCYRTVVDTFSDNCFGLTQPKLAKKVAQRLVLYCQQYLSEVSYGSKGSKQSKGSKGSEGSKGSKVAVGNLCQHYTD